jgi:hypothetical protein
VRLGAGQNDGLQKCWLNGELTFEANDLLYRNDAGADKLIGAMHWHNYHGGSDDQWAPKHDQHIWCVPGIIPHCNCIESVSPDPESISVMVYLKDVRVLLETSITTARPALPFPSLAKGNLRPCMYY